MTSEEFMPTDRQLLARRQREGSQGVEHQGESTPPSNSILTARFEWKQRQASLGLEKSQPSLRRYRKPRPSGCSDPRLPKVGSIITKTYKGRELHVHVVPKGFEFSGKRYRSLSAVAKDVTGSIWNGYLFFDLTPRSKQKR